MTARRPDAGRAAEAALRDAYPGARLRLVPLDLCDPASIAGAADAILAGGGVDILCNNAGGIADGTLATMFAGNVRGPVQLTDRLLPALLAARGKVVNLSSLGHAHAVLPAPGEPLARVVAEERGSPLGRYGFTKLCNVWHARALHRAHHREGLRTYALHPGGIATEGFEKTEHLALPLRWGTWLYKTFFAEKDVRLGAQTTLHCMASRVADGESGLYYDNCAVAEPKHCDDPARFDELLAWCRAAASASV
jgi:NAD(P)-dependent dehydrogenase (short-subunit alcohol dehydrogenase family)